VVKRTRKQKAAELLADLQNGPSFHIALVMPFIASMRGTTAMNSPVGVDDALGVISAGGGHHALIYPPFVAMLRGTNNPKAVDEALDTVAASGNHHALIAPFLMSYYGSNGNQRPVDREIGTVTTTDRHALVQGQVRVEDCGFRMLEPHEIGRGMAFDDGYVVLGNKRQRVRQYGNAVTPPVMQLILERCLETLR
jgi:DNA (cytosine-5)-methyltransferase 1